MNEAKTRLYEMIAVMDDPWMERWAAGFGLIRRSALRISENLNYSMALVAMADLYPEETMSEFRARCIETLAPQVATEMAGDLIDDGHEIDIVTGDRV